jgi:hypothetical protein
VNQFCVYREEGTLITRRQFLTTGALAGAGFLTWPVSNQGQPTPTNLTGAWHADDGGIYYIRHLEDNSIWWAGLHNSGAGCEKPAFHLGVWFTNGFRGVVNMGQRMIEGSWADVPRGSILQHGRLSLSIETPSSGIELRQNPAGTTGGFRGRVWWPCIPFPENPFDINYRFKHVRRGHSQFSDDNTPFKDFAVVFATITENPIVLRWPASVLQRDYCHFVKQEGGDCFNPENDDTSECDGDLVFNVYAPEYDNPQYDAGFWKTGWINSPVRIPRPDGVIVEIDSSTLVQRHLPSSGKQFHCEVVIFGRTNNEDDCEAAPNVLLPGWGETEGDSVLLNGRPTDGHVEQVVRGSDWEAEILGRRLHSGLNVRVTGVVNLDDHAMKNDIFGPMYIGAPEIHPVYSIDVIQDFEQPRPDADLTGVWHCDDVGTYYLRQVGNVVWWLGLSQDQGGSFANVFQGTMDDNSVIGEWVDIPMGLGGARSSGHLKLSVATNTPAPRLGVFQRTGGFGGSLWTKLYDWPDPFFRG